ncbi:glycosyltransferase family 39 protein [Rufibacter psychrotolerans]|uniref:glycosyltransferase family 39 protein n=1 Tax=Rufibacter psychrotolerans TaxID=2812556 RepID=UPI001966DCA3|nr:glycosyltransferase family 39 protein [Rufibacter sp. SYSU D00308]
MQSPLFWFLAVSSFTLVYFFAEHEGFYFGDDYSYSLYAHQLIWGGFHFDDYSFCHRFMVFVPTALFYWLWGMNIYTTTLWPLLCTLGTLLLLYLAFRKAHPVATSWALVLLGLYYFQLNTVNYLYPDNILLFFTTACLLVLYRARTQLPSAKQEITWGILFAFLNLLAFLTKETIVYTVPFYLFVLFQHIRNRENLRFWGSALVSGTILLALYFLLYKVYSGDALQRLYDIKATNTVETKQAYLDSRSATLLPRLTYEPVLFFIGSGLAIPLVLTIFSFFTKGSHRGQSTAETLRFWFAAMVCMLLPIWFGTATVDFYKPMPLVPRMFHPLLPTFCLSAGLVVEKAWGKRPAFLLLTFLFVVCTVLAGEKMWVLYAPLAAFFALCSFFSRPLPHWLGLIMVTLVLAIRPVYFMAKPTVSYYFEQKEIVDQHLNHRVGKYTVLMDSVMLNRYRYFYGFHTPTNYQFKRYTDLSTTGQQNVDTVFLLINNGVLEHPELMMPIREKDVLPLFPAARLITQKGKVKLYYLPKDSSASAF